MTKLHKGPFRDSLRFWRSKNDIAVTSKSRAQFVEMQPRTRHTSQSVPGFSEPSRGTLSHCLLSAACYGQLTRDLIAHVRKAS